MALKVGAFSPSLEEVVAAVTPKSELQGNVIPIVAQSTNEGLDPVTAYLKLRNSSNCPRSFLFEISERTSIKTAYSVIGVEPFDAIEIGGRDPSRQGDPLVHLEPLINAIKVVPQFKLEPKLLNGGAFGYISYDCVRYFEPKVDQYQQENVMGLPESVFMFFNSFVIFDHKQNVVRVVALCPVGSDAEMVKRNYQLAIERIHSLFHRLNNAEATEFEDTDPQRHEGVSNVGRDGYKQFVVKLRERIIDGDIIQAVPSQRVARKIGVHPFNIYKQLRVLNPSHYMFFLDCEDFHLVGSSPEMLVRVDDGIVTTHPIAGTRKRGETEEEDQRLAEELLADEKERAEHVMLVDLGRNDINRVCTPTSMNLDAVMIIEKYSHVMHIVSHVEGRLRSDLTQFDAIRSIFPAGTLSGAPKVKAMELIAQLEKERRNVYGGAVGYFSYSSDVDTCIAIRTITVKDSVAYLQAGGGIVYDSDPEFEYLETVNKMAATQKAIDLAEEKSVARKGEATKTSEGEKSIAGEKGEDVFNGLWSSFVTTTASEHAKEKSGPSPARNSWNVGTEGNRVLLIDNYDSFTWNLYEYLSKLGQDVLVFRNDKISIEECRALNPDRLVISPGPGWPQTDSGVSIPVTGEFVGKIPILGVCMGHECLVEGYNGKIGHCNEIVHGKTSPIEHDGKTIYEGVPNNTEVTRYHSLAALKIPDGYQVNAKTKQGVVMGMQHEEYKIVGVQFHPESIKCTDGMQMLRNFTTWTGGKW